MAGLFAPPRTQASKPPEPGTQALFVQLKAVCVPLLEATRAPPIGKTLDRIVHLLAQLRQILQEATGADFTPALANYVFFPLSALLQPPTAATTPEGGARSASSRGDAVLEATMLALESLIHVWRQTGMEPRVRQELWIMTILTLGGPLDPNKPVLDTKGKGKALQATEEAQLAMVKVLVALMRPIETTAASTPDRMDQDDDDDDPLGERLDWLRVDPQDTQTFERGVPEVSDNPAPPIPILFHTLTTLLALASEPTSLLALQLSSLEALRILITHYLAVAVAGGGSKDKGPAPLLATALPGTASTLSRIATSRPSKSSSSIPSSSPSPSANSSRPQASAVVVSALETLSLIIRSTLADAVTEPLRKEARRVGDDPSLSSTDRIASLEEIDTSVPMDLDAEAPTEDGADDFEPPPPSTSAPSTGATTTSKGPTIPTPQWLRYTLSSLEVLFTALSPVAAHESPLVRAALVHFLDSVLSECGATLGPHAEAPLEGLLTLAGDDWRDQVAEPARRALVRALNKVRPLEEQGGVDLARSLVSRIVQRRFASLPGAVRRRDELAIRRSASIVRVGLSLFLDVGRDSATNRNNKPNMQVLQSVEKWSWNLLSALELERVAGSMASTGQGGMALAWITTNTTATGGGGGGGDAATTEETSYPATRLRGITDESTVRALERLWSTLGSSAASSGFGLTGAESVVEHLLGFALGPRRNEPIAASSLWALDGVLLGTKDYLSDKEQRRIYRQVARAVVSLLDDLRRAEEEDSLTSTATARDGGGGGGGGEPGVVGGSHMMADDDDAKELQRVEHRTGVLDLPSLDAYKPVATRHASEEDRASQRILLTSWSLRLLATCASLLQSAFQPLLMQSLYHILELSSPTSPPLVAMHAQRALSIVSDSAGYASPQNLVLSNVDYVVNSVSQRLAVARLDPSAPLVLVEMIRLVGKPIVPMVQDLVDDVFEALDDYHGYEEVTVGLWAVLDALLKVMEEDLPEPNRNASQQSAAPQATENDWQALDAWIRERTEAEHGDEAAADIEEVNPQRPFKADQDNDDAAKGTTAQQDDEPTPDQVAPPTRTQVVTAQILSKALYFLSHDSPFLRARVLSLIASAVPLLALPDLDAADPAANRAADLMPVIHRAWPYILNRLSDPEPYVVVEAAGLVESLARNVGEFMSRRIVDDVWPRFKTLLGRLDVEDRKSALSTQDRHSTSFRIYRSILQTLGDAANEVPLKEDVLWDQAVSLRRFLSTEYHKDLQTLAVALYHSLGRLNADLVWLVLGATVRLDPSLPGYLAMEERFVRENVRTVLADL